MDKALGISKYFDFICLCLNHKIGRFKGQMSQWSTVSHLSTCRIVTPTKKMGTVIPSSLSTCQSPVKLTAEWELISLAAQIICINFHSSVVSLYSFIQNLSFSLTKHGPWLTSIYSCDKAWTEPWQQCIRELKEPLTASTHLVKQEQELLPRQCSRAVDT